MKAKALSTATVTAIAKLMRAELGDKVMGTMVFFDGETATTVINGIRTDTPFDAAACIVNIGTPSELVQVVSAYLISPPGEDERVERQDIRRASIKASEH